jgi:thioredoxin 1
MAEGMIILDEENFDEVIKAGITLVDFYADWCGPCRMLSPILEEISDEMKDQAAFGKLDIERNQKIAGNFQVTSVPTLILFKDGKEVNRLVGLRDANGIKDFISSAR